MDHGTDMTTMRRKTLVKSRVNYERFLIVSAF